MQVDGDLVSGWGAGPVETNVAEDPVVALRLPAKCDACAVSDGAVSTIAADQPRHLNGLIASVRMSDMGFDRACLFRKSDQFQLALDLDAEGGEMRAH